MSSLQLRSYCALRIVDVPVEQAAEASGLGMAEARLWEADRERGEADFTAIAATNGESEMARDEEQSRRTETVAADELRLLIERIERLEEEKKGITDDVKDVYSEAKSRGYDTKTMRKIVALRKMETHVRQEADSLLATYCKALGIQLFFDL